MNRSDIISLPTYFDHYILKVEDIELNDAFENSIHQLNNLAINQLHKIGLKTYQEGKWTTHKIIQHIIDWERIWCYRTLINARGETTISLPHDEESMAQHCNADERSIQDLLKELITVRQATQLMFQSFNRTQLQINCKFNKTEMSVLAMGFNIIGHHIHHFNVIEERYYPLV